MHTSHNVNTARMTGGSRHETPPSLGKTIDKILADIDAVVPPDTVVHETPDMLEAHVNGPTLEDELRVGHIVMSGEQDAAWAYEELGRAT